MTKQEQNELTKGYQNTLDLIDSHKKIIKPWKKEGMVFDDGYARGWNDCLKEVERNHRKFVKHIKGVYDQQFKTEERSEDSSQEVNNEE